MSDIEGDDTDYETEPKRVSVKASAKVIGLATDMRTKEKAVKVAEAAVETAKKDLATIRDGTLPAAIKELGVDSVEIDGIGKVAWSKDVYGGLPSAEKRPEERAAALAWFEANAPGLIKRKLTALLPREEGAPKPVDDLQIRLVTEILKAVGTWPKGGPEVPLTLAEALEKIVRLLVPGADVDRNLDIHGQTLMAWGREQIVAGRQIPFRTIGLTPVDRAKITANTSTRTRTGTRSNQGDL